MILLLAIGIKSESENYINVITAINNIKQLLIFNLLINLIPWKNFNFESSLNWTLSTAMPWTNYAQDTA